MNFLPIILVFAFFLCLSVLSSSFPGRPRILSHFFNLASYVSLLIMMNQFEELHLTKFFYLSPLKIRFLNILACFGILICLINGLRKSRDLWSSTVSGLIFLGAVFFLGATEFLTFYLCLEFMGLLGIGLIALSAHEFSPEASMKIFFTHGIFSGLLLMAMAFFYAGTGGFEFGSFSVANHQFYSLSVVLFLLIAFQKLGVFPFHSWAGDLLCHSTRGGHATYFLIINLITGFNFILLLQGMILECVPAVQETLIGIILTIIIVNAFYSNFSCIAQNRVKKFFSCLYMATVGPVFLNLVLSPYGEFENHLMFYMMVVSLSATNVFLSIDYLQEGGVKGEMWDDLKGCLSANKLLGLSLMISAIGLLGGPFTMGFFSKYLLFSKFVKEGYFLTTLGILLTSIMGFGLVFKLYHPLFEERPNERVLGKPNLGILPVFILFILISGGFFPSFYWNFFRP